MIFDLRSLLRANLPGCLALFAGALLAIQQPAAAQALALPTSPDKGKTKAPPPAQSDKIITNAPVAPDQAATIRSQGENPKLPANWMDDKTPETIVLPKSVPDPIEPFNRAMYALDKGVMIGVVKPTARLYRTIVIKPVRTGINNFSQNIRYPGRLVNNLLEAKWAGARDETKRFFCNTFVGAAGFVDVASKWKIPKSEKDFGLTFGYWGWKPQFYLMLPIFGPSNDRDAVGLAADSLANPITWFPPYSYAMYGFTYNNLTDSVEEFSRFARAETDAYSELQYAWTFVRKDQVVDFRLHGEQDESSLETLQSVFFTYQDREFPANGDTRSVRIPSTGRRLKYTYWLQQNNAPVVYIVPGLGSHRLAETALALAELVYKHGFSAVCVSSVYNAEFMEHALTAPLPSYTPVDTRDLHVALTEVDHQLRRFYPGRLGAKALMGYSMGAFHSLFIAAAESTNDSNLIKFDRYVSINTPVRLLYGVSKLDEFYRAPLEWPAAERTDNIENTFLKVAALGSGSLRPSGSQGSLPFSAIESKFLIGLAFRFILRDVIYDSQSRYNQGVLREPIRSSRREPAYREIMNYSYKDYFEKFVVPYYKTRGIDLTVPDTLAKAGDMRAYAAALHANPKIRLIINRNDFLLADEDYEWLRATFDPKQMTVFEKGGHLGNLSHPAVQKAILNALDSR
jgi:ABC-type transporter lipoprotein component MlaA/pimeloyl-ACP methyl ester carboxylesterase